MDVRKLCLESSSHHYLRWNELIPRFVLVKGNWLKISVSGHSDVHCTLPVVGTSMFLMHECNVCSNRRVIVDGDVALDGDAPKRGFCCKVISATSVLTHTFCGNPDDSRLVSLQQQTCGHLLRSRDLP